MRRALTYAEVPFYGRKIGNESPSLLAKLEEVDYEEEDEKGQNDTIFIGNRWHIAYILQLMRKK